MSAPDPADILLHVCCAPCATYPVRRLRDLGLRVVGYWHNPNIHPWQEHEARRKSLVAYAQRVSLQIEWEPGYAAALFMQRITHREAAGLRCIECYRIRLEATARRARSLGIPRFTTTLLISPYQNHDLIRAIGEEVATEVGVEFYYDDFRVGWPERGPMVKEFELYRQQYCGCLYSEFERYTNLPILEGSGIRYEDL